MAVLVLVQRIRRARVGMRAGMTVKAVVDITRVRS